MKSKKGFTLIELLAVIVILAIIAIIATPIVLNIINDTRESAQLRSADNYLKSIEQGIANSWVNGVKVKNGTYRIMTDGNICTGVYSNEKCNGNIVKVDVNGQIPQSGKVTIKSKLVQEAKLKYENNLIVKNNDGEIVISDMKYDYGDVITFDPGDGVNTKWYVIGEDKETVTLILDKNLGNPVDWATYSDRNKTNDDGIGNYGSQQTTKYSYTDEGPLTAIGTLINLTKDWNVEHIKSFTYINETEENEYDYQQIKIENGNVSIFDQSGNEATEKIDMKARLITMEELLSVSAEIDESFSEENITAFLNDNISIVSAVLGVYGSNIDELATNAGFIIDYPAKYYLLSTLVLQGILQYDMTYPEFLIGNLSESESPMGYWTLSSFEGAAYISTYMGYFASDTYTENIGIRPVITVNKNKLGGK